jgi:hemolysin activation/secretion protein
MSIGLVRDFLKKSHFRFGIGIEQNNHKVLENTILEQDSIFGVHEKLTILPLEAKIDLDFRDEKGLPYRGSRALISYYNGTVLNFDNENFGLFSASLEQYFSNRVRRPITLGLRLGGAKGHGTIPWYKLPTLGNNSGLRGYFENRFAGKSMLFFNSELRYQFVNTYTAVVPVKAGVKVFYDRGRVFQEGAELNKNWRQGYGFGFFLTPLDENYTISLSFGFSEEESVYPVFSFGTPLR